MSNDRLRKVWETVDAIACAVVVLGMAWLHLCTGRDALWSLVAISAGRSGLLMVNAMLVRLAGQLGGPGGPSAGGGVSIGAGDRPASPPPPPTPPTQLPTSPLAILFALFTWASKLGVERLAPIAVLAGAMLLPAGCASSSGAGSSAARAGAVRRFEVTALVYLMDAAVDSAAVACAEMPSTANAKVGRCFADLEAARLAGKRSAAMLLSWDQYQGPIRCAVVAYGESMTDVEMTLAEAGMRIPPLVDDVLDYVRIVDRMELATCSLKSIDAAIPDASNDGG